MPRRSTNWRRTFSWDSHELSESCLKLMQVEKAVGPLVAKTALTSLQERLRRLLGGSAIGDACWRTTVFKNALQEIGPHVYESVMDACHKRLLCEHSQKTTPSTAPTLAACR